MDETPGRIEPILLADDVPSELVDLSQDLVAASAKLSARIPPAAVAELAGLVRIADGYYSNLIEGHDADLVEVERSLASSRPEQRLMVREAIVHLAVRRHSDDAHAAGRLGVSTDGSELRDIHRRFYEGVRDEHRTITSGGRTVVVVPGAFRSRPQEDVAVERHVPPSSVRVSDFMEAFERRMRAVVARRRPRSSRSRRPTTASPTSTRSSTATAGSAASCRTPWRFAPGSGRRGCGSCRAACRGAWRTRASTRPCWPRPTDSVGAAATGAAACPRRPPSSSHPGS